MVKKIVLNCGFPSGQSPVTFYVGSPSKESHPISFQSQWLSENYGGTVPEELMKSMEKLQKISIKNKLRFEDLCEYVFKEVEKNKSLNTEKSMRKKQVNYLKQNDSVSKNLETNQEPPINKKEESPTDE